MAHTPPEPSLPIADRVAQVVNIPASLFVANATNEGGEQLPVADVDPPIENLELNLWLQIDMIETSFGLTRAEPTSISDRLRHTGNTKDITICNTIVDIT